MPGLLSKLRDKFAEDHSVDGWLSLWYTVEATTALDEVMFLVVPFYPITPVARKNGLMETPVTGSLMSFKEALVLAERLNNLRLATKP